MLDPRPGIDRLVFGVGLYQSLRFPSTKNDDFVDAATLVGLALDMTHPSLFEPEKPEKSKDAWAELFEEQDRDLEGYNNWKTA